MTTITLTLQTESREFPPSTVEEQFLWEVFGPNALKLRTSSEGAGPVNFVDTDYIGIFFGPGDYVAKVSKNGVAIEQAFTIAAQNVVLAVPFTLSVVVS